MTAPPTLIVPGNIGPEVGPASTPGIAPGGPFAGAHVYPVSPAANATSQPVIGSLRLAPQYWPGAWISAVGCEFTIAGDGTSTFIPVVAQDNGQALPALVVPQIAAAAPISGAAIAVLESAFPGGAFYLPPAYYWFGGVAQGVTAPTLRAIAASTPASGFILPGSVALAAAGVTFGVAFAGVVGAIPPTLLGAGGLGITGNAPPRIFFKLA